MFLRVTGIVLFLLVLTACGEKPDKTVEEEAIKAVIEEERLAWEKNDYDAWASTWIQSEDILWMRPEYSSPTVHSSWQQLNEWAKPQFIKQDLDFRTDVSKSDWKIRIYENGSWATFAQCWIGLFQDTVVTRESRVLEKQNGSWKLVHYSVVLISPYPNLNKTEPKGGNKNLRGFSSI